RVVQASGSSVGLPAPPAGEMRRPSRTRYGLSVSRGPAPAARSARGILTRFFRATRKDCCATAARLLLVLLRARRPAARRRRALDGSGPPAEPAGRADRRDPLAARARRRRR